MAVFVSNIGKKDIGDDGELESLAPVMGFNIDPDAVFEFADALLAYVKDWVNGDEEILYLGVDYHPNEVLKSIGEAVEGFGLTSLPLKTSLTITRKSNGFKAVYNIGYNGEVVREFYNLDGSKEPME